MQHESGILLGVSAVQGDVKTVSLHGSDDDFELLQCCVNADGPTTANTVLYCIGAGVFCCQFSAQRDIALMLLLRRLFHFSCRYGPNKMLVDVY